MSTVGAYIEIPPGHSEPDWSDWENLATGRLNSKGSWGMEVNWDTPIPDNPQVYLIWEPRVVAVWNNEEEIENGEDREDTDGSDVEQRGKEVPAEPDLGAGEGGEGYGDVQAPGTEGGFEEVE